jgi:2',3'-cyclic-nucleotide 2'-phosphodiesterase (5'-nucleotidase family)
MVSYGNVDIAYIGITTPYTITSSSPTQFRDENGEYLYTFNPSTLYDIVQDNIDSAKKAGAEYVVALSHIGYADDAIYGDLEDVETLIKNTDGLDVVLDGHSHSVIEEKLIIDEGGNEVVLSSTGTKFEYIGKLVISNGDFDTSLIKTEDYKNTDKDVDNYLEQIELEYGELGNRIVAYSEVDLITHDADGNRLVRKAETNLGDLCAEAIRSSVGADIGYVNGGGIRSNITAGNIKFNDLLNVFPFNNTVVLAQVSGKTIMDMLEMAMMKWPSEDGCFPHLAGVAFSFNTSISSSVVVNEREEFQGVSGQYRVYDIKVFNRETQKYEPIDLDKKYTIAAANYYLLEYGSGMTMFKNAEILKDDGILDVEALENYITNELNGRIGQEYANVQENITFTE